MKLTPYELKSLHQIREGRKERLSIARIVALSWKRYLFLTAYFGGFALFFYFDRSPSISMLFAGFLGGGLFRDWQWIALIKRLSPLHREITDWERVDRLLAENAPA